MLKIGNISFREGLGKDITFTQFKKAYAGKLKGVDIREAYVKLGGKLKK